VGRIGGGLEQSGVGLEGSWVGRKEGLVGVGGGGKEKGKRGRGLFLV
jgi:hypothetical protein